MVQTIKKIRRFFKPNKTERIVGLSILITSITIIFVLLLIYDNYKDKSYDKLCLNNIANNFCINLHKGDNLKSSLNLPDGFYCNNERYGTEKFYFTKKELEFCKRCIL